MLLSEAITHRGNQWGQITISFVRRQRKVWPGRLSVEGKFGEDVGVLNLRICRVLLLLDSR